MGSFAPKAFIGPNQQMQLQTLSLLDGLFIVSIYITLIREHAEGTLELPALIKTGSNGGENIPHKSGSGKRGRLKKKKKSNSYSILRILPRLLWENWRRVFDDLIVSNCLEKHKQFRARLNSTGRGGPESECFPLLPRALE